MKSFALILALASYALAHMRALRTEAPAGWNMVGPAEPAEAFQFSVYLNQVNVDQLWERFHTLSDPNSSEYGQWMTQEEVLALVSPPEQEVAVVKDLLAEHGLREVEDMGDILHVRGPVATVERLFKTKMMVYRHEESGRELVRQYGPYSVPDSVEYIVDFVRGLDEFPVARRNIKVASASELRQAETGGIIEPIVISEQYKIKSNKVQNPDKATQGPFEFDAGQVGAYGKSDLSTFAKANNLADPKVDVIGPYYPTAPNADESNLDIQFIAGVAQDTQNYFWTVSSGFMLEMAEEIARATNKPKVCSVSWGADESEISGGGMSPTDYVRRTDVELAKVGVTGITVVVATGDNGSSGGMCGSLQPDYPATSPAVTSVGATMLQSQSTGGTSGTSGSTFASSELPVPAAAEEPPICSTNPVGASCASPGQEIVCSFPSALITSGGGFSNVVPQPSWQSSVVSKYLSTAQGLPPSDQFNSTGRGYPDVSAFGHAYLIHNQGQWVQVDGTSCSTPVFAAMVTLLNDQRISAGKSTLGPINQALYDAYNKDPTAFNDITSGNNKCHEGGCCEIGYPAAPGWDAASGLGSPNFEKLSTYFNNLQ